MSHTMFVYKNKKDALKNLSFILASGNLGDSKQALKIQEMQAKSGLPEEKLKELADKAKIESIETIRSYQDCYNDLLSNEKRED